MLPFRMHLVPVVAIAWLLCAAVAQAQPADREPTRVPAVGSPAASEFKRALRSDATRLRDAMVSVYFFSQYESDEFLEGSFRPLPLDEAVERLRNDESRFSESRLRRALAKLVAAPRHPLRARAIRHLAAPRPGRDASFVDLLASLEQQAPLGAPAISVERAVVEQLDRVQESIPGCVRDLPETVVSFDWKTGTTKVTSSMQLDRSLEELRLVMDPQNWDQCSPQHFASTYVTNEVTETPGQDPAPATDAPTPGSNWDRVVFEHFLIAVGDGKLGWFKVLLDATSTPSATEHRIDYAFKTGLHGSLGPLENEDGGLDLDDGHLFAKKCSGRICVGAEKRLRLDGWGLDVIDYGLNLMTWFGLQVLIDESYEMVCCEIE